MTSELLAQRVGHSQGEVILDHARRQNIERCVAGLDRIVAVVKTGTQSQRLAIFVFDPNFENVDTGPAKTDAVASSQ